MDAMLMAVTVVSLGIAIAMGVVAWRASHAEKQRSAARVAALAAEAGIPAAEVVASPEEAVQPPPMAPWRSPLTHPAEPSALDAFATEATPVVPTRAPVVASTPLPSGVAVQTGFLAAEGPVRESPSHQRWLAAAAAVVAVLLGSVVFLRMGDPPQAVVAASEAATSLELLSLRHEREGVNLSVAGLVRNPPAARVIERVSAVVLLFDQHGQFITSAKAPIDFLKLTAGDESPFVVKVAAPQSVARYRVSFRTDDGTVPHVDRRGQPVAAAPVALAGK